MGKKHLNCHDTSQALKPLCKYWPLAVEGTTVRVTMDPFSHLHKPGYQHHTLCSLLFLAQGVSEAPQHPAAGLPWAAMPPPAFPSDSLQKGSSLQGDALYAAAVQALQLRKLHFRAESIEFHAQYTKHTSHCLAFIRPCRFQFSFGLQFSLKWKLTILLILSAVLPPRR